MVKKKLGRPGGLGVPVALTLWQRERPVAMSRAVNTPQGRAGPRGALLGCTQESYRGRLPSR